MTSDIKIRVFEKGDEKKIVELLKLIFNKWPDIEVDSPLEHWIWKYHDNPIKTKKFMIALSGEKEIGAFGLFSNRVKILDKILLANSGVDVGTHPDYRGKGIYSAIRRKAFEMRVEGGYELNFGVESNPYLIKSAQNSGTYNMFPFTARHDYKIFDIDLHYHVFKTNYMFIKKILFKLLQKYLSIINKFSSHENNYKYIKISEITSFDHRINDFWDKVKEEYDFIFAKSQSYLNWRYCDPRGGKYFVRIVEKDETIVGYIVYSARLKKEYPFGYIIELLTLSGYDYVKDILLKEALSYFAENNVNFIQTIMVSGHSNEKIFNKYVFLKGAPLFLTYSNEYTDEKLMNWSPMVPDRIHFCYGDYDT